jgi:hypothetical protein
MRPPQDEMGFLALQEIGPHLSLRKQERATAGWA